MAGLNQVTNLDGASYTDLEVNSTPQDLPSTPTVLAFKIDNSANDSGGYLKVFSDTTTPANGDEPREQIPVAAGEVFYFITNGGTGVQYEPSNTTYVAYNTNPGQLDSSEPDNPVILGVWTA